jgi:4-methyl-5(b-hydroxyethyl)-thiazole monophosphate biosynthesis
MGPHSEHRTPSVLVPVTHGTEDLEAVATIDILRRAGCHVVVAGIDDTTLVCARKVRILADARWEEIQPDVFDMIAVPGGAAGTERFLAHPPLHDAIRRAAAGGRWVAAICAAPLVLQAAGVLQGRRATCHPAVRERLIAATYESSAVVVDGRVITSQGAGTAVQFALTIVHHVCGEAVAARVASDIVYPWPPRC